MMKKFLISFSFFFLLSGCQISSDLQANIFRDLWSEFVTEKDDDISKDFINKYKTADNEAFFYKLNEDLTELKKELIIGKEFKQEKGEKAVFVPGFMTEQDEQNESKINQLKSFFDLIENDIKEETGDFKNNTNRTCKQQKTSVPCGL